VRTETETETIRSFIALVDVMHAWNSKHNNNNNNNNNSLFASKGSTIHDRDTHTHIIKTHEEWYGRPVSMKITNSAFNTIIALSLN